MVRRRTRGCGASVKEPLEVIIIASGEWIETLDKDKKIASNAMATNSHGWETCGEPFSAQQPDQFIGLCRKCAVGGGYIW